VRKVGRDTSLPLRPPVHQRRPTLGKTEVWSVRHASNGTDLPIVRSRLLRARWSRSLTSSEPWATRRSCAHSCRTSGCVGGSRTRSGASPFTEMTPHTRAVKWTLSRLNRQRGKQVKVVGQLMLDNVHANPTDDRSFSEEPAGSASGPLRGRSIR